MCSHSTLAFSATNIGVLWKTKKRIREKFTKKLFRKPCEISILKKSPLLFPDNQISRKRNLLRLTTKAVNIIILGQILIKLQDKSGTYACTLLVNGVERRVGDIFDTFPHPVCQPVRFQLQINLCQFLTVIRQFLKKQSFGMTQKKEISSFD